MTEPHLNFIHHRINPTSKLVILIVLSFGLMILDNRFTFIQAARSYVATIIYPLQWAVQRPVNAVETGWKHLEKQVNLVSENTILTEENTQLKIQVAQQEALLKILNQQAQLHQLQHNLQFPSIIAQAIYSGRSPFSNNFVINRGSQSAIHRGDAVTDAYGLIGQVESVQPISATVRLITENHTVIPVMIARTGEKTLIYGRGSYLELPYLPNSADLKEGDILVTSGIDEIYPIGIPVAQVGHIQISDNSPYYQAKLSPTAQLLKTRFVLVIPHQDTTPNESSSS